MQDAALEMIETMSCPVNVAEDQADRTAELVLGAELARGLAGFAAGVHPNDAIAPVLRELAGILDRHARELAPLVDRLGALVDHDRAHSHVELDDLRVTELLRTMFAEPHMENIE